MSGRMQPVGAGYVVRVLRSRGRIRRRFHVRIEGGANGRVLLWSRKYPDHDQALGLALEIALGLRAPVIDDSRMRPGTARAAHEDLIEAD